MKFVRFDGGNTGLVVGTEQLQVLDIAANLPALAALDAAAASQIEAALLAEPAQHWRRMIGSWDEVRGAFAQLESLSPDQLSLRPFDAVALEPPLAGPDVHIFAMGSNTTDHIVRAFKAMANLDLTHQDARKSHDDGLPPFGFTVWPAIVVGPGATVTPPKGTQKFDYEAECAVYVKQGGRDLQTVELWGYTAFNDLGIRDTHLKLAREPAAGPFSMNTPKNFDSGKSCGPWVVVDENANLPTLRCQLTVNGQPRQDWNLSEMIYGFNETLSYLSSFMTLRPGDMLSSGTGAGVAIEGGVNGDRWLQPGDAVEITLDGVAPLRNTVGAW